MSTFYPVEVECPDCGREFRVDVVRGIHATRLPWARQQILEGRFQVFACAACGRRVTVQGPTVYTDFKRHQYVAVETAASATWQEAKRRHEQVFETSFDRGPQIAREMGRSFTRRLVFGLGALREKLLLWDADLDDYVCEAVKGDLFRQREISPAASELRLVRVLDGGHLLFARLPPRPRGEVGARTFLHQVEPIELATATAEQYRSRAESKPSIGRDYPWLGDRWFVDISDGPLRAAL